MMRVAITGATGFIGKHAVRYFSGRGDHVVSISRDRKKLDSCFGPGIEKFESDYSEESLTKAFAAADIVIHLAAKRLSRDSSFFKVSEFFDANILLTEEVLSAAKNSNVSRVCYTSSISVYSGRDPQPCREDQASVAGNVYGISKLVCEQMAESFSRYTDIKTTGLRLGRVFGAGEREDLVFMKYLKLASQKQTLSVFGEGKRVIDFIYIEDVLAAIAKAIRPDAPAGIYNIGSGRGFSVREVAETINKVFDNDGNIKFDLSPEADQQDVVMDISKAGEYLGWRSAWSLEDAVRDIRKKTDN